MGQKINQIRDLAEKAGRFPDAIEYSFGGSINFTDGREAYSAGQRPLSSWFTGTSEQIAEDIHSYQAVGVNHFRPGLSTQRQDLNELLESMERFAKDVIPLI